MGPWHEKSQHIRDQRERLVRRGGGRQESPNRLSATCKTSQTSLSDLFSKEKSKFSGTAQREDKVTGTEQVPQAGEGPGAGRGHQDMVDAVQRSAKSEDRLSLLIFQIPDLKGFPAGWTG